MREIAKFLGKYFKGDSGIWTVMVLLSLVSMAAIYSATGLLAYRYHSGHVAYYVLRHGGLLLVSWVVMFCFHRIKYTRFARLSVLAYPIVIVLLIYALMLGEINGANRWVRILGFSFQPSEFAKVVLVAFMSRQLTIRQSVITEKSTYWRLLIFALPVILLIFFDNLSTAMLLTLTCFILMVVGGVPQKRLWATVGVGMAALVLFVGILFLPPENKLPGRFSTWKHRIENFAGSDTNVENNSSNYQADQAKIAVASGKVLGKGPGNSTQRNFVPHPYSDYVYALIIEEYGVAGGLVILVLYLWLLRRGMNIAKRCKGLFGSCLVMGLTFMLTLQALVNMGVAVGFFPVTGQPLPFVSMGGTSSLFTGMALGMIQSVALAVNEREKREAEALGAA